MPPVRKFTAVSLRDTIPPQDVPPHHIYMAFNIDADATAFRCWWAEQGAEVFAVWLRSRPSGRLLADIEAAVNHEPEPDGGEAGVVARLPNRCEKCDAFKWRSTNGGNWYCPRCER